jgi:hypothetical protein
MREKNKAYREAHQEELRQKKKDYYEANKEREHEKRKKYRDEHKEEAKRLKKLWYEKVKAEGRFKCDLCNYVTGSNSSLETHLNTLSHKSKAEEN